MNPRLKEALLWGVVGLLTFLVLLQAYEIIQGVGVDLTVKIGAAVLVGVASTVVTYLASGRVDDAVATEEEGTTDGKSATDGDVAREGAATPAEDDADDTRS